jgi:chemotaxis protein MotB
MKHTMTLVALLSAAACVSPEAHRQVKGANSALQAQIAGMAEAQRALSAENARLRAENSDLGRRAADASWIEDQKKRLAELLAKYGEGTPSAQNGVELVRTPEGYAFRVAGGVLFSPGQNTLSDSGRRTLTELASQLQGRQIRIEGHTDDQPIQRSQWGTNLRLSVERAMVVSDFLTKSAGLQADNVSVAGYGEYRPTEPRPSEAGSAPAWQQKNRRVEILLIDPK